MNSLARKAFVNILASYLGSGIAVLILFGTCTMVGMSEGGMIAISTFLGIPTGAIATIAILHRKTGALTVVGFSFLAVISFWILGLVLSLLVQNYIVIFAILGPLVISTVGQIVCQRRWPAQW
jgi:hypothetical protein